MVAPYVAELQRVYSTDRLERYRPPGGTDQHMVVSYLWNIELCESLYQGLSALEMVLRNTIHHVLTISIGQPNWYDFPKFLQKREYTSVANSIWEIQQANKQPTPGRVVASLNFGVWTALLSEGYGRIWSDNNHTLVKQAFPYAPVSMQYRRRVHGHFNAIRLLRNSVFHHEPIFDDPDLLQKHTDIIDAIGWVSPTVQASVRHFDRFPTVYAGGTGDVERRLKLHLGIP